MTRRGKRPRLRDEPERAPLFPDGIFGARPTDFEANAAALDGMARNIGDAGPREAELCDLQLERERDEAAKRRERGGRSSEKRGPKQKGIPEREMFWIIERRLENSATHSR